MYSRIKKIVNDIDAGEAFRKSRGITAGIGGIFFVLGNILQIPVKKYLEGYGAATTAASVGAISFLYKLYENYTAADAASNASIINDGTQYLSTNIILDKFAKNSGKTRDFLQVHGLTDNEINALRDCEPTEHEAAQATLLKLYNSLSLQIEKYPVCLSLAAMNMACHFMECMLVQVYADPNAFLFSNDSVPEKVILALLIMAAIYNGLMTFLTNKREYENPAPIKLCAAITKAFDAHDAFADPEVKCRELPRLCFA